MTTPSLHIQVTSTVSGLSDDRLLEQTRKLAGLDHQIHVFVIDHLCEIEARRVYLSRGFSSLFDYVKRGLGYSDAATWRRINAMKLCTRIDGVRERLWDGSLTLDAAAQLQAAFGRRDRERGRGAGAGTGSAVRPNGSARPAPEPKPGPVLDVSVQKALVEQAAGKSTREVTKMLADVDPALAVPADRLRPLGEGRWELKAVIDADCHRGLEQLKGLLSHVDPHMTLGQLVGRLVNEGLDRHDPGRPPRRGRTRSAPAGADRPPAAQGASSDGDAASEPKRSATHADATTSAAKAPAGSSRGVPSPAQRFAQPGGTPHTERDSNGRAPSVAKQPARPADISTSAPKSCPRAGRAISAEVKREIWQRDGGRCRFVDPRTGRRCASRHLLQIDHVFPYALGGGAQPENLRLLCFAHHRDRHTERTSRRGPPA